MIMKYEAKAFTEKREIRKTWSSYLLRRVLKKAMGVD